MFNSKRPSKFRFTIQKTLIFSLIAIFTLAITADIFSQNIANSKTATTPVTTVKSAPMALTRQADSSGAVTGIPWTGAMGVTETTAEIMERDRLVGPEPLEQETESKKVRRDRSNLPQNPDSPRSSRFPTEQPNALAVEPHAPQTPDVSFTGATLSGTNPTGSFPPDTMGAVGPTQFVVMVNGRLVTFNKTTGVADAVLNTTTNTFFNSVRNGSGTSDPRVRYDRLSQRWFLLIINVSTPNRVLLAVSDTATITGGTVWTFFQFQQELAPPIGDATCLADYPTLGIDANALYIGVNQFCGAPPAFGGTTAFVVRKSSVLGAGPLVVTAFRNLTSTPGGVGMFTPQGVDNYDPAATEGYFIGVDNATFGTLVIRRVTNPGGTPTLSADALLTIPATSFPITVRHSGNTGGTSGRLSGIDDRLFAAHIRNGRLWTAHNISVDNTGSAVGTRTRNASRWYEISGVNTALPTLVQSGTLFASSGTNTVDDRNYWIPSVMVSGQGHMALGASIAGTNEFANAVTAGRLANDPLGTLQAPAALTASSTAYNPPGDPGTSGARRWGDYSYTSLDPCDDMTMWTIQEFCDATNSYGVRAVKLLAPPPATPVTANPAMIPAEQPSVNITITGNQVAGSGFFDPGAGFGCRIGATINGVTVNNISYVNTTTVVLNVSTVGATNGAKDVTVTNPDGQSRAGNGIVTVFGAGGCTYLLSSTNQSFAAAASSGSVTVSSQAGCNWTAVSNSGFITVTSGAAGSGNGTVQFNVAVNATGAIRNGTITIAGQTFTVFQGLQFADVPVGAPFYTEIGKLAARGVTLGCSSGTYCPNQVVTREQMAAFIIRALGEFNPPTPGSQRFTDVPPSNIFYNFIDRMAELQITLGCGGGNYCPNDAVTREQMAAFLMRAKGEFSPPVPPSQRFNDVLPSNIFYNFIDRLAVLNITLGCSASPPLYCPTTAVTRDQMAAFLVRAFNL